jgi:hypothetical protein
VTKALICSSLLCILAACESGKSASNHSTYVERDPHDVVADGLSKRPSQAFLDVRKQVEGALSKTEKSYASSYNLAGSDGQKIAKDKNLKAPRRSVAKSLKLEIDEVREENSQTAAEALAETLAALREVNEDAESCADLDDDERILNCAVAWLLLEVQRSRAGAPDAGKPAPEVEEDAGSETDTDGGVEMDAGSDAGKADAGQDASMSSDAGGLSCNPSASQLAAFVPSNLPPSLALPSAPPMMKGTNELDTDALSLYYKIPELTPQAVTLADGSEAALFVVQRFELGVGQTLKVSGQRPLIIVALDDIVVGGQIVTAASKTNGYGSAGAPGPTVAERKGFGPGGGAAGMAAKAGGSGGSFCGRGGRGNAQTTDGTTYGTPTLVPLLGGSSGGVAATVGGLAGGALQLVAGKSITINEAGLINMTGSGGPAWGGGSSGGAVLLEAPKVTVTGTITANGGAGGSYYGGAQGTETATPAVGGNYGSGSPSSRGGSGSAGAKIEGDPATMGEMLTLFSGGGGGAGRIRINTGCGVFTAGSNALITPFKGTECYSEGMLTPR